MISICLVVLEVASCSQQTLQRERKVMKDLADSKAVFLVLHLVGSSKKFKANCLIWLPIVNITNYIYLPKQRLHLTSKIGSNLLMLSKSLKLIS